MHSGGVRSWGGPACHPGSHGSVFYFSKNPQDRRPPSIIEIPHPSRSYKFTLLGEVGGISGDSQGLAPVRGVWGW